MGRSGGALVGAVAVGVLLAAVTALAGSPRVAGYLLAGVLAGVGVCRLVLPGTAVGPFAVRTRALDAGVCGSLALALAGITHLVPL